MVPNGVHEPSVDDDTDPEYHPPVPVDIYTLDYNRGDNPNKIAQRTVQIFTPRDPYLNVPGGARWPAGSPITIQVRRHNPNTEYRLYLQQGPASSPTFSELINGATFSTYSLGEYDMSYTIPASYIGFYVIRSYLPTDLTHPIASYNIEFIANPYIAIDNGNRWSPYSTITIRLKNHAALPHQVWLDKGGPFETFLGTVNVKSTGEGVVNFTIPTSLFPASTPAGTIPRYLITSYLQGEEIAHTYLEVLPADLRVTNIEVPNVTFDVEIPITVTIANLSPVTIANTYFDNDLYIDPDKNSPAYVPLSTDSGLPPGDYKTWLDFMPPSSTVKLPETIVLYGPGIHSIYGRADTTNWVAEGAGETNNVLLKSIDFACPVSLSDEFPGDGLSDWTQTDFGDSGVSCTVPPDLPPVTSGETLLVDKNWDGRSADMVTNPADGSSYEGFTFDADPAYNVFGTSGTSKNYIGRNSSGDPGASLYVGPRRNTSGGSDIAVSSGAWIDFQNSVPNVTISFKYLLGSFKTETGETSAYYFILDPDRTPNSADDQVHLLTSRDGAGYAPNNSINAPWQQYTLNVSLTPGWHRFFFGVKASPMNSNNEYALAYIDALRISETNATTAPPDPAGTIWSAHFDSGVESFSFAKDAFYGFTTVAQEDPSGNHTPTDGAWVNGALYTKLGRTNGTSNYTNMTGGWSRSINVPAGDSCVTVQGYYRLKFAGLYDAGEESHVLLAIDDTDNPRVLATRSGGSSTTDYDSGWVAFKETFSATAGTHTLTLGGYNNGATQNGEITEILFDDVYVVSGAVGGATSIQTESGGSLLLTNKGSTGQSTVTGADDNGANAGYHLMHRTVGTGPFYVYARLDQPPANSNVGLAGLEIRGDPAAGGSPKLMLARGSDNTLYLFDRTANNRAVESIRSRANIGSGPIWLKVVREDSNFTVYYLVSSSDTPPTTSTWTQWGQPVTLNNLPETVEVGLFNAPGSSSTTYQATFKHFYVCATTVPGMPSSGGQGYLGNKCGQVEEGGNKLVVIDTVNTIINQSGGGHTWTEVSKNNVLGESAMSGLQGTPDNNQTLAPGNSPHATYQANIQSAGTYYVWVAGWGPNTSGDDVRVGYNGTAVGLVSGFPTGTSSPGWVKMPGSVSASTGINTFDLWVNKDGAIVFKILLTQDNSFTPPPSSVSQSPCSIIVQPPQPPLSKTCFEVIRTGDFEGVFMDVYNAWPSSGLATFTFAGYNSNRGILFPVDTVRIPTIQQTFNLPVEPGSILSNTTAVLKLKKAVDLNGASNPDDVLRFELRRASDNATLVGPIVLADGQDRTGDSPPIPDFDPYDPHAGDLWTDFNQNIFAGLNPLSFLQPGDQLKVVFYSPKGAAAGSTYFYADNLSLEFCTSQPAPEQQPGLGQLSGKTLKNSLPIKGVSVWAYANSGSGGTPGPVFKTQSIDDGTYRFYNLPPGRYLIYTEMNVVGQGTLSYQTNVEIFPDTSTTNIILDIRTG